MRLQIVAGSALMLSLALDISAQSVPSRPALERTVRIDGTAENLSAISWIAVSAKGVIAVLQPQDRQVLFFSSSGKRIGAFGRGGEGPGEFRAMGNIGWVGDTLWVRDNGKRKLIYITPVLKLLREVPDTSVARGAVDSKPPCSTRVGSMDAVNPYCARTITQISEDSGLVAIVTQQNPKSSIGRFTVTLQKRSGDTVFNAAQTTPSVQLTSRLADSIVAVFAKRLPPEIVAYIRSSMPGYFAPVQIVRVAIDGTVWLRMSAEPGAAMIRYMVLGSKGSLMGTLMLPRQLVVHAVSKERIWTVEADSTGSESVVGFRVRY